MQLTTVLSRVARYLPRGSPSAIRDVRPIYGATREVLRRRALPLLLSMLRSEPRPPSIGTQAARSLTAPLRRPRLAQDVHTVDRSLLRLRKFTPTQGNGVRAPRCELPPPTPCTIYKVVSPGGAVERVGASYER